MKISMKKLEQGPRETGRVMHKLVKEYFIDMSAFGSVSLMDTFRYLADIPFRPDPKGHELVQRPKYTLRFGGDCDDKAICMASYAMIRGYGYRFRAIGKRLQPGHRIPLTHVYTELKINNKENWISADCTYSYNILGQQVSYDRYEFI